MNICLPVHPFHALFWWHILFLEYVIVGIFNAHNLLQRRWGPHNKCVRGSRCVMNSAEQSHTSNRTQGDPTKLAPNIALLQYIIHTLYVLQLYSRGWRASRAGSDPREFEPQLVLRVCTPDPPSLAKCHQTLKYFFFLSCEHFFWVWCAVIAC